MEKEIDGILFDVQRFCVGDGPGIRTTLFFKGCPLRCKWCHNPESWEKAPQLIYRSHKCSGCLACVKACKCGAHYIDNSGHAVDFSKCTGCAACIGACCYGAVEMLGKKTSVSEAISLLRTDYPYYGANGGVTFSGGEPAIQPAFATALAEAAKNEGINLCIETCGFADTGFYERIQPFTDLFLFDWKAADDKKHQSLTGVSNALILENLAYLNGKGKRIILRCPMIPDVNDTAEDFQKIADIYRTHEYVEGVELMPYHIMGESKKLQIGREAELYRVRSPDEEDRKRWAEELLALGCPATFG